MKIKNATIVYNKGSRTSFYYGQLEDGNYFRADDWWDCIIICSKDTSQGYDTSPKFYDDCLIKKLSADVDEGKRFWNEIMSWLIENNSQDEELVKVLKDNFIKSSRDMYFTARLDKEDELTTEYKRN